MKLDSLRQPSRGDAQARQAGGAVEAACSHPGQCVPLPPASAVPGLRGRRVLVVDDNALNREVVSELLLAVKVSVDTAINGAEALRMIEAARYDAILMDIHMPEMNGLSAARAIRSQPRFARLPLVALTAQASAQDRDASLAAGMNAHLTKPIDGAVLYSALVDVLGLSAMTAADTADCAGTAKAAEAGEAGAWAGGAASAASAPRPAAAPSRAFSLARLGSDPERLRRVLAQFLHDTADTAAQLSQRIGAGELHSAAALVHPLRGAALYLNAHELCAVAGRIESAAARADAAAVALELGPLRRSLETLRGYIATCLAQLPHSAAPGAATAAAAATASAAPAAEEALPALLERVIPLVAQADYAAQRLLEQILRQVTPGLDLQLARTALAHFSDLELEESLAALRKLQAALIPRR